MSEFIAGMSDFTVFGWGMACGIFLAQIVIAITNSIVRRRR